MSCMGDGCDRMTWQADTLKYYAEHAEEFAADTQGIEFSAMQSLFLHALPEHSDILDFGCGAGRDSKAFLMAGHRVTAIDGCPELCRIASRFAGIPVRCMTFDALEDVACYDGIWASASLLHLRRDELVRVLKKIRCALRMNGILYTSFKYGDFEGMRNGRFFIDMTEARFDDVMRQVSGFDIGQSLVTSDMRPGREHEKWLNLLMRKCG